MRVGSVAVSGIQRGEQRPCKQNVYGGTSGGKRNNHRRGHVRKTGFARQRYGRLTDRPLNKNETPNDGY